ncbi:MAG TPA: TetR/AcrR family transcriptional regulator [Acidimicrobiales bacterium]|nr:TetR/AcrR family transcriptional regulator [Acidimicrobiales bacterium]
MSSTPGARRPDRSATEAALQKAALLLLERNGVLAGLNLRQVADEAGVNRGLVYHYFGSRRDLLRAALRSDVGERMSDFGPGRPLPAPARYERFLRTMLHHQQAAMLATLLILDGDRGVRMVPDPAGTRERIRRDVDEGHLPPDVDADGLHAALAAMVYGYVVMRDHLADELDVEVQALDEQVATTIDRLIRGLARSSDTDG